MRMGEVGDCGIGSPWRSVIPRSRVPEMLLGMTLLWFVIWLIFNVIGDKEPIELAPVNWWAGTLILAIALDLNKTHVIKHRH